MSDLQFTQPQIILAPMAGYTDAPMREIVSQFGADAVVSEMLASAEWKSGRKGVDERVERGDLRAGTRYIVQIAGRDPLIMAEAARFAQAQGADQVDINMGCPARKVVAGATAGAALLREPELALAIVEKTAEAVKIPVSVKTRLGWDQHDTKNLIRDFEQAGAQMFSIHGRTRNQHYDGQADWRAVGEIKDLASVAVFVNGDIVDINTAKDALAQSGADGVMIGRAAIGQPWLLGTMAHALNAAKTAPKTAQNKPSTQFVMSHFDRMIGHYGAEQGVLNARKHLKAYFRAAPKAWLKTLLVERDPAHLRALIDQNASRFMSAAYG